MQGVCYESKITWEGAINYKRAATTNEHTLTFFADLAFLAAG